MHVHVRIYIIILVSMNAYMHGYIYGCKCMCEGVLESTKSTLTTYQTAHRQTDKTVQPDYN